MSTDLKEKYVAVQTLAWLLDLTPQRINQLVAEGWIRKSARNSIFIKDGVKGHLAFVEDRHEKTRHTATDDELRAERARKLRLENDRTEGKIMETDAAFDAIDKICATIRIGLAALPARVTRELALRRKIEDEVDRILTVVSAKLEDRGTLLAGGEDAEAAEEDDNG